MPAGWYTYVAALPDRLADSTYSVFCQKRDKAQILFSLLPKIAQSRCLGSGAGGSAEAVDSVDHELR